MAPRRIVTLGSSMGGYAAIRVGLAINADEVLAFSPQVPLDPAARKAERLETMYDDVLQWLALVSKVEGVEHSQVLYSSS